MHCTSISLIIQHHYIYDIHPNTQYTISWLYSNLHLNLHLASFLLAVSRKSLISSILRGYLQRKRIWMRNIASHTWVNPKSIKSKLYNRIPWANASIQTHMLGDPMDAIRSQRKIKTQVVHNENIIFTYILFVYNSNICEKNSLDTKHHKP